MEWNRRLGIVEPRLRYGGTALSKIFYSIIIFFVAVKKAGTNGASLLV